jgi:hypothetical protein
MQVNPNSANGKFSGEKTVPVTPDQKNITDLYNNISEFCTRHLPSLWQQIKIKECLALFNVKLSAVSVISQHIHIAEKGSADFLHIIKQPLARLTADLAQLMKVLSGKKSGWWRNPPAESNLLLLDDAVFIAQCRLVYNTANRMMVNLEQRGLTLQLVNTLKTAIDVYNAVVPPPKAVKSVEQHYRNIVKGLLSEADEILKKELDPAMQEAASGKPVILHDYKTLREVNNEQ